MQKKSIALGIIFISILSLCLCACHLSILNKSPKDTSPTLAEWQGGKITEQEFNRRLSLIPDIFRPKTGFTIEQKQKFLHDYVVEDVFYEESRRLKLYEAKEVQDFYNKNAKPPIVQKYQKDNITNKVIITDDILRNEYEAVKDSLYTRIPSADIYMIQTATQDSADFLMKKLNQGMEFSTLAAKYTNNPYVRKSNGKVENIHQGGNITALGYIPVLDSLIFSSPLHTVVGPVFAEDNFHILMVVKRDMSTHSSFASARHALEDYYKEKRLNELKENVINNLKKKYDARVNISELKNKPLKALVAEAENISLISAKIPQFSFTVKDFLEEIKLLPEPQKQYLESYSEQVNYLEQKLVQELMYYDAVQQGYADIPSIKNNLHRLNKVASLRYYYKTHIIDSTTITENDLLKKYNDEKDARYTIRARASIRQFVFEDLNTAEQTYEQALQASDEELDKLAETYSLYKNKNGLLPYIYEGGSIPDLGRDDAYNKKVFETPVGTFSQIFKDRKDRFVFFKVLSYQPKTYKDFDGLRNMLTQAVTREKQKSQFEAKKQILFKQYHAQIYPERLEKKLPVDTLYALAEKSMENQSFSNAISYYDQIIKYYKNNTDDYKATFMKGFIYSEYLHDQHTAKNMFQTVLQFPKAELHESAQYMIKAMESEDKILELIEENNSLNDQPTE